MSEETPLYWLVYGRIPHDDEDTVMATVGRSTRAEAESEFRQVMVAASIASRGAHDLRRLMDNIGPDQPLTDGVIVTGLAWSESRITCR